MRLEKSKHRVERRRLPGRCAQIGRVKSCQRKEALRARIFGQRPRQSLQPQRLRVGFDCAVSQHGLRDGFRRSSEEICVAKRVIVVEDNELNLKLFCDLLRAHGYETEAVKDAREAVGRATTFAPDIAIVDIQMPHLTGLELIEAFRRDVILRRTPIMAVTAYAGKGDEDRIREAGADAYVAKPISLMKFVESVKGLADLSDSRAMA